LEVYIVKDFFDSGTYNEDSKAGKELSKTVNEQELCLSEERGYYFLDFIHNGRVVNSVKIEPDLTKCLIDYKMIFRRKNEI
jgi:hypothetical protein